MSDTISGMSGGTMISNDRHSHGSNVPDGNEKSKCC